MTAKGGYCDPNGDSCVLFSAMATDPLNCGGCNQVCARNEVCTDTNCEAFQIGRGCTSCPCSDCPTGRQCCIYPGTTDLAVCLDPGVACP
jgi:hypothetical protein